MRALTQRMLRTTYGKMAENQSTCTRGQGQWADRGWVVCSMIQLIRVIMKIMICEVFK